MRFDDVKSFYLSVTGDNRKKQMESVSNAIDKYFNFSEINCIETGASQSLDDGCFGLYLAKMCEITRGSFISVDLDENIVEKSKEIYEKYIPGLNVGHHVSDSVSFLQSYEGSPNLVHLDSWDLDINNPVPAMLHGWLEFEAIKDKMPSGSLILIDDNFLKGTVVYWDTYYDGKYNHREEIPIKYDIVGKGALIYHWCKLPHTDWNLIEDDLVVGSNNKIIVKKR